MQYVQIFSRVLLDEETDQASSVCGWQIDDGFVSAAINPGIDFLDTGLGTHVIGTTNEIVSGCVAIEVSNFGNVVAISAILIS